MMTRGLRNTSAAWYVATQSLWTYYSGQTTEVKTPEDALVYNCRLANGRWAGEPSLRALLRHNLERPASLKACYIDTMSDAEKSKLVSMMFELTWAFLAERGWSFAARHEQAPECYGHYFIGEAAAAAVAIASDSKAVYWIDEARHVAEEGARGRDSY